MIDLMIVDDTTDILKLQQHLQVLRLFIEQY